MMLAVLLVCGACQTPCDDKALVQKAGDYMAVKWECKHPEVIHNWVNGMAEKVGLCTNLKGGVIGSTICGLLLDGAQKLLVKQVPTEAECNPALIGADAVSALKTACSFIPF